MTHDAVDHRGGDGLVAEDPAQAAEGPQVGGEDQRRVFVPRGGELNEQVLVSAACTSP